MGSQNEAWEWNLGMRPGGGGGGGGEGGREKWRRLETNGYHTEAVYG